MKNIHVLPTDKPSKLWVTKLGNLTRCHDIKPIKEALGNNVNIYITNDEEIKEGEYGLIGKEVGKIILTQDGYEFLIGKGVSYEYGDYHSLQKVCKKIILTTDQYLIKDGVQAIDDEFLEWFVKNPICEEFTYEEYMSGKYLIPKEEPKQLFTDYPITELGDEEFKESPIRECELLSYDDNKYCYVKVEGIEKEIKRCYIYPQKGRCGDVDCVSIDEIKELLKEEPKQEKPKFKGFIENSVNIMSIANSMFGGKQEPKLQCKDCNDNLTDCTCIEDTIDMKQETGTAVEWLAKQYNLVGTAEYEHAKEMEKQQQGYSEEEVEDLIYKVCGTVARLQGITLNGNHINTAYEKFKKK